MRGRGERDWRGLPGEIFDGLVELLHRPPESGAELGADGGGRKAKSQSLFFTLAPKVPKEARIFLNFMASCCACPTCRLRYQVDALLPGRRLRCRQCREIFTFKELAPGEEPGEPAEPADDGDVSTLIQDVLDDRAPVASPLPIAPADPERYRIQEEVARGGMGQILRASDRDLRRDVAMKVMLDGAEGRARARFVEEAQVTAQLEHPNIVPVHELGVDVEGRPFFTMKLVKGRSLGEVLKGVRENPERFSEYGLGRLLGVFVNVCNAVAFAHSRGVLHRDLKPANLMLGDFGEVLVMDWGLAKVKGKEFPATAASPRSIDAEALVTTSRSGAPGLTMDGTVMGTPFYMAPEQAAGEIDGIDARTDVYALGAILYEILTLKPPVEGKDFKVVLKLVKDGVIQAPEEKAPTRSIPRELSAVAMKALSKRPEDRYPGADALRGDVELYLQGRAVSAKADTGWESLVKLVRRNRGASAVAGVAAAVLLAASGLYVQRLNEARGVAERHARAAGSALEAFKGEQDRRLKDRKASAPALVKAARLAAYQKDWATAGANVDAALDYDPDAADAILLKALMRLGQSDPSGAIPDLEAFVRRRPGDANAKDLLAACRQAGEQGVEVSSSLLTEVLFGRQEHVFAEPYLKGLDALAEGYRKRLVVAYPGWKVGRLNKTSKGGLFLDLKSLGVKDLEALRGMRLQELDITDNPCSDLEPLRGMNLAVLNAAGHSRREIKDLEPLRGMPLRNLNVDNCKTLVDLAPLAGMPLEKLSLFNCSDLRDLSPLRGAPLRDLSIAETSVSDLSPLEGMHLEAIDAMAARLLTDIRPLAGMPLQRAFFYHTAVRDLSPLIGAPLKTLGLSGAPVRDFSPLKGMPLESLTLWTVEDFTPLEGLPLKALYWETPRPAKGIETIRRMPGLVTINRKPVARFWEEWDAGKYAK